MSTDRETTRLVRSWMEEGVTALPDRVLDAVLDQVPTTPQRRSWWPVRRSNLMNTYVKLAFAAAAVLVVAIVGYQFVPGVSGPGAPTPSPTASQPAVPTPGPSPTERPIPLYRSEPGFLPAGSVFIDQAIDRPFVLTVPANWTGLEHGGGEALLIKTLKVEGSEDRGAFGSVGIDALLGFYALDSVFADPCHDQIPVRPGPTTVDEVIGLLAQQTGMTASGISSVTVGGLPATQIDLVNDIDPGTCVSDPFSQWTFVRNLVSTPNGTSSPGHQRIWVMDVGGQLLLINALGSVLDGAYPEDIDELLGMVSSVVFD